MIVKDSRWEEHEARPKGGFPFYYAWVNNAGMIEGQYNKIDKLLRVAPRWTTQPLGLFASSAILTGQIRHQYKKVPEVKSVPKLNIFEKLKLKRVAWSDTEIQVPMMSTRHYSTTVWPETFTFTKQISDLLGVKDLYNSRRSDLFFFALREGEVFVDWMLAGRKLAGAEVYFEANHKTAKLLHNDVMKLGKYKKMNRYCEAYFKMISDLSLTQVESVWNPKTRAKSSSPSWSVNVSKNSRLNWPKDLDNMMDTYLITKDAYDVKIFSWCWWFNFFTNPLIPLWIRERTWANVQNWYRQAGVSYSVMLDLMDEAIDRKYDKYTDCTHLVVDLSPEFGFSFNGRDSTGVTESIMTKDSWMVNAEEDKQRDVSRALTSSLSILDTWELTQFFNAECHNKLVIDGKSWMNNKRCLSGCDKKNSDQQTGINVNLISYGKVRAHIIDALCEASGELWTPFGNEGDECDQDDYLGLQKHVRTYAGDDVGLNLWDPSEYVDLHAEIFPWTFKAWSAKQTLKFINEQNMLRHLVFNLGNTCVYDRDQISIGVFKSPKIVKTEQTPLGATKGRTEAWSAVEYSKARFADITRYEMPLWFSSSLTEFEQSIPRLLDAISSGVIKAVDLPDSLRVLVQA